MACRVFSVGAVVVLLTVAALASSCSLRVEAHSLSPMSKLLTSKQFVDREPPTLDIPTPLYPNDVDPTDCYGQYDDCYSRCAGASPNSPRCEAKCQAVLNKCSDIPPLHPRLQATVARGDDPKCSACEVRFDQCYRECDNVDLIDEECFKDCRYNHGYCKNHCQGESIEMPLAAPQPHPAQKPACLTACAMSAMTSSLECLFQFGAARQKCRTDVATAKATCVASCANPCEAAYQQAIRFCTNQQQQCRDPTFQCTLQYQKCAAKAESERRYDIAYDVKNECGESKKSQAQMAVGQVGASVVAACELGCSTAAAAATSACEQIPDDSRQACLDLVRSKAKVCYNSCKTPF